MYSGHTGSQCLKYQISQCLKYQILALPDGMAVDVAGPFAGRHNACISLRSRFYNVLQCIMTLQDMYMMGHSSLREVMARNELSQCIIYCDKGYDILLGRNYPWLRGPHTGACTADEKENTIMSRVCIDVISDHHFAGTRVS